MGPKAHWPVNNWGKGRAARNTKLTRWMDERGAGRPIPHSHHGARAACGPRAHSHRITGAQPHQNESHPSGPQPAPPSRHPQVSHATLIHMRDATFVLFVDDTSYIYCSTRVIGSIGVSLVPRPAPRCSHPGANILLCPIAAQSYCHCCPQSWGWWIQCVRARP